MSRIIVDDNARVGAWVAAQMGKTTAWSAYQAIGLEREGELIAGVVIDGYQKHTRCSIHCAGVGRRWLNREFLHVVFNYVFGQLQCKAVVNPVDAGNADSIRFTSHLGFTEAARIPEAELIIFTLPRANCRWLTLRD